jgi:hypothetical protein
MPKGTRVARCVERVKKEQRKKGAKKVNPYAVCQESTKQSYKTGRKLVSVRDKGKEWHKKQYKKRKRA